MNLAQSAESSDRPFAVAQRGTHRALQLLTHPNSRFDISLQARSRFDPLVLSLANCTARAHPPPLRSSMLVAPAFSSHESAVPRGGTD